MRSWRRDDDLERVLGARRPEPRRELVESIARKVAGERRSGSRKLRLGVAVAFSAAMFAVLGAFGGLSHAANGVTRAVSSAVHMVAPVRPAKIVPAAALSSAQAQYFVAMCLDGATMNVDSKAAASLAGSGATTGACKGGAFKPGQRQAWACVNGTNVRVPVSQANASNVADIQSQLTFWRSRLSVDSARHASKIRIASDKATIAALEAKLSKAKQLKSDGVKPGFCG